MQAAPLTAHTLRKTHKRISELPIPDLTAALTLRHKTQLAPGSTPLLSDVLHDSSLIQPNSYIGGCWVPGSDDQVSVSGLGGVTLVHVAGPGIVDAPGAAATEFLALLSP